MHALTGVSSHLWQSKTDLIVSAFTQWAILLGPPWNLLQRGHLYTFCQDIVLVWSLLTFGSYRLQCVFCYTIAINIACLEYLKYCEVSGSRPAAWPFSGIWVLEYIGGPHLAKLILGVTDCWPSIHSCLFFSFLWLLTGILLPLWSAPFPNM